MHTKLKEKVCFSAVALYGRGKNAEKLFLNLNLLK